MRPLRFLLLLPVLVGLGGCNLVVLDPSGHIAAQQRDLLLIATGLMLLIIVPVMALTVVFAVRYRHGNTKAHYDPEWHHSTILELVIWSAPLAIIICLGAVTYLGTHLLDPYRPLTKIDHARTVEANVAPLEVQVVALDWKWLFIYPQYGVASVNEMAAPVDRPIHFKLTSAGVMNAFYVPELAGMIYTMAGMETQLHAVINKPGEFKGFSSNYSGEGFSGMRFAFKAVDDAGFEDWIAGARADGRALDRAGYLDLVTPSENVPAAHFGTVEDGLFGAIVERCVEDGQTCMSELMADASGFLCGPKTTAWLNSSGVPGQFTTAELDRRFTPVRGAGLERPTAPTRMATDGATPSAPTNL